MQFSYLIVIQNLNLQEIQNESVNVCYFDVLVTISLIANFKESIIEMKEGLCMCLLEIKTLKYFLSF